jgi:hypothetical protein
MKWILSLCGLLLLTSAAAAGVLAPSKASQLVEVGPAAPPTTCSTGGEAVDSIHKPDGTTAPFVIPPNEVLVITEVELGSASFTPGDKIELDLGRRSGTNVNDIVSTESTVAPSGEVHATLILPNGASVASGVSLCAFAFDLTTLTGPLALVGVVHGFFAPAE